MFDPLTPDQLTAILKTDDVLQRGDVIALNPVEQEHTEPFFGEIRFFEVEYSADANDDLPARILVKTPQSWLDADFLKWGDKEVEFYNQIVPLQPELPVPRCYEAMTDSHTGASRLILEDLSLTHTDGGWPKPPPRLAQWTGVLRSLADVHTCWWGRDTVPEALDAAFDRVAFDNKMQRIIDHFPTFVDVAGSGLVPAQRKHFEHLLASDMFDQRLARLSDHRNIVFRHGDDHLGNYMLPHDEAGRVLLIDWHLWTFGVGTDDLVDMLALRYFRRYCNTVEQDVLRTYHQYLGVEAYSWDDLWYDYRLSIAATMLSITLQFTPGAHLGHQWEWLEMITGAYEALQVVELFLT